MVQHRPSYIVVIFLTLLLLLITIFFYFMGNWNTLNTFIPGLYQTTLRNVTGEFYLDIAPPEWSLNIWIFIYFYQLVWILYGLGLTCRKTNDWQGYLYFRPNFMPVSMYIFYWIALILNVAWILTFDRKLLQVSSPVLLGVSFSLYICLGVSYRALYREGAALLRIGHKREIVFTRLFVQNGLSTFAAWTSIASLLNITQALAYLAKMDQKDASSIALGLLALEILSFLLLDNILTDKYTRYTLMPYLVFIFILTSTLFKNWTFWERNATLIVVDLALAAFALLLKISLVARRWRDEPEPILRGIQI